MKIKTYSYYLVIVILIGGISILPAYAGTTPFTNGNLDSWSSASNVDLWLETTSNGFITQENSIRHTASGSSAKLSVQAPAGDVVKLQHPSIAVSNGQDYIFAVWVLDNFAYTYIRINITSGSNGPISDDSSGSDSASWRQLSVTITADSSDAIVLIEIVEVDGTWTEDLYVDDATFTGPISEFPFQNLLFFGFPLMIVALILVRRHQSN